MLVILQVGITALLLVLNTGKGRVVAEKLLLALKWEVPILNWAAVYKVYKLCKFIKQRFPSQQQSEQLIHL